MSCSKVRRIAGCDALELRKASRTLARRLSSCCGRFDSISRPMQVSTKKRHSICNKIFNKYFKNNFINSIQSHLSQWSHRRLHAVLTALCQESQQNQRWTNAIPLSSQLQLTSFQLTKHLSEKWDERGESRTCWILWVWRSAENFIAFLIPLSTCVEQSFEEGFLLLFRYDRNAEAGNRKWITEKKIWKVNNLYKTMNLNFKTLTVFPQRLDSYNASRVPSNSAPSTDSDRPTLWWSPPSLPAEMFQCRDLLPAVRIGRDSPCHVWAWFQLMSLTWSVAVLAVGWMRAMVGLSRWFRARIWRGMMMLPTINNY